MSDTRIPMNTPPTRAEWNKVWSYFEAVVEYMNTYGMSFEALAIIVLWPLIVLDLLIIWIRFR